MRYKVFLFCAIVGFLVCVAIGVEGQTKPKNTRVANISPSPVPTSQATITSQPTPNNPLAQKPIGDVVGLLIVLIAFSIAIYFVVAHQRKQAEEERQRIEAMTPEERETYLEEQRKAKEAVALARVPTPPKLIEYRRTCQVCGKVWHSLPSREKRIQSNVNNDALMGCGGVMQHCGTCGAVGGGTAAQASRNLDANQSELQRLKSCPECSSVNYKEEVIEHENQTP